MFLLKDKQYETLFYIIRSSEDELPNGEEQAEYKTDEQETEDQEEKSNDGARSGGGGGIQNLSRMFSLIETNKQFLNIESYYISQTTLEQLFMSFANRSFQIDESQFRQNSFSYYLGAGRWAKRKKKKMYNQSDDLAKQTTTTTTVTNATSQIVLLSFRQFEEQPVYDKSTDKRDQFYF